MKKAVLKEAEKRQKKRKQIMLALDPEYDKEVLKKLESVPKKQTYIKELILKDI